MNTVQVLISTYNGEEYICSQIESILAQKDVNVKILVRDDGSTDSTPQILYEYSKEYENISYIRGKNCGVVASFFRLFELADPEADYYALSDQDDIWDSDKLSIACKMLDDNKEKDLPALYCCESVITDDEMNTLADESQDNNKTHIIPDFKNALIENIARGGGCVFNAALLKNIQIAKPEGVYMHDWWLYLVASCFGTVIHDPEAHYKYRQHQGNVLGASTSFIGKFKRRLKQSKENKGHIEKQILAFNRMYKIPEDKQTSVDVILKHKTSKKYRIKGFSGKYVFRQNKLDNLIFRFLFLTNHL